MNKNKLLITILVLLVLANVTYWVSAHMLNGNSKPKDPIPLTPIDNPQFVNDVDNLPASPAVAARKDLANRLSIEERFITITGIEETEWTDGCLGLGGPAESCLQALVPGYRIEMFAQGKVYLYRTDQSGLAVRAETQF
jgi:hypothetical protein